MAKSKLTEFMANPEKALIIISLPVIGSGIVETLYTVVDAIYVGRLGADALAAITFAWPFFFILVALSLGLNAGINSRISRYIGEKNKKEAQNTMLHGLLACIILSVILTVLGIPFINPLIALTGATGNVLQMASDYIFFILIGVVFMFASYTITSVFAAEGDTKTAMKLDVYSLALNIILDPVFIFYFHMGVKGAAIATTISVFFALVLALYYMHKNSYVRMDFSCFRFSKSILKEIINVGFPSSLMMLTVSFSALFLNKVISTFAVSDVAAFGVAGRLESLSILPIYGLSVGAMTLAGMFYGAKKKELVQRVSNYAIKISIAVSLFIAVLLFIFPGLFVSMFTSDTQVISAASLYLRLEIIMMPTAAAGMKISRIMQGMGYGIPGFVIAILRALIITVPLAYLFVFTFSLGFLSVPIAIAIGSLVSFLAGLVWMRKEIACCGQ